MSDTITMSDTIKPLAETVRGRVITVSDPDADVVRADPNTMHARRPGAVTVDDGLVLETAFGHRNKSFAPVVVDIWPDFADDEANAKWVRAYYAAIHRRSGSAGGYSDFMSGDDDHRAADNHGASYERLSAVEAIYDPDNVFHVNQNIAPANGR